MRDFTFVRRYLFLNRQEKSFIIHRETMYKIQANTYEDAVLALLRQIDSAEGRDGVLVNNGFPTHCVTGSSQSYYLAYHLMAAYVYRQETGQKDRAISSFREQLTQTEDGGAAGIYQGFYADDQLLCPRALTVHRLQCTGDEFNYLFETEAGRYQGEYEKYLFYEHVLYTGAGFHANEIEPGHERNV